jgi:hypothetical protein
VLTAIWARLLVAVLGGGCLLAGCSSSSPRTTASPSPLTPTQLQARYTAAASTYNANAARIAHSESTYCDPHSASADLTQCQKALSEDRQATLAFDSALRRIAFSVQAAADVRQLLADDAALETLLEQAATAPSLTAIAQLTGQIFPLLNTTANDASKVRTDLGLPQASPG